MTVLYALYRAYESMEKRGLVPPYGYSEEKISFVLPLKEDGTLAGPPIDVRDKNGRNPVPRKIRVPRAIKRSVNIAPNFLWDKTSYVLGITAKESKRLTQEHEAFVAYHKKLLSGTQDKGLQAFLRFFELWVPDQIETLGWDEQIKQDILDQNIIFILEKDRIENKYIHQSQEAMEIWASALSAQEGKKAFCPVLGKQGAITLLHPAIKGILGGQSSGSSLVSFNLDAFTSYGHEQGTNAQISEKAAFAYGAVLNKLLEKGSKHRMMLGDTTTVFWAEAEEESLRQEAEDVFLGLFNAIDLEANSAEKIAPILEKIRSGKPIKNFHPDLGEKVRFYILGLAPNAARISLRFWYENSFGKLAENYQAYERDMEISPPDPNPNLALWQYLCETATLGKTQNVLPKLAGDWFRAIITGMPYPETLFSSVLLRIRADGKINARRVSILKALLIRNFKTKEELLSFDPNSTNKGYLLGRLFAVYERVQETALGGNINATIKDKFYGSASTQPRRVFPALQKGSVSHLSKIGKGNIGTQKFFDGQFSEIMDKMGPTEDPFPLSLSQEEQALFTLGYYHQRSTYFQKKSETTSQNKEQAA